MVANASGCRLIVTVMSSHSLCLPEDAMVEGETVYVIGICTLLSMMDKAATTRGALNPSAVTLRASSSFPSAIKSARISTLIT